MKKAASACRAVRALNPACECVADERFLNSGNAMESVRAADVVIDATDNVATRYLLGDACVLTDTPLVSGAAVGTDGQATVYGFKGGACYRCRHPRPPAVVHSCAEAGVLGPVPGLIGCMLAMEAVKVIVGMGRPLSERLYHYDALEGRACVMQLPPRRRDCAVCGKTPSITSMSDSQAFLDAHGLVHGERECSRGDGTQEAKKAGSKLDAALDGALRISCVDYFKNWYGEDDQNHANASDNGKSRCSGEDSSGGGMGGVGGGDGAGRSFKCPHILLDVRPQHHFEICALPGAINLPLKQLGGSLDVVSRLQKESMAVGGSGEPNQTSLPVFVLCRRGVSSVKATRLLVDAGFDRVRNIDGGLTQWAESVDPELAIY